MSINEDKLNEMLKKYDEEDTDDIEPISEPKSNIEPKMEEDTTIHDISKSANDRLEKEQKSLAKISEQVNTSLSASPLSDSDNVVGNAIYETKRNIVDKAMPKINDEKIVEKHAKKLAENADESIRVELEQQQLEIAKGDAKNKVTRKEIANQLFVLKQEAIRLKKEQKHLNKLQKEEQIKESDRVYWANHGTTLEGYKMHEGSNRTFCNVLLWLDGVKGFFLGLGKVSTALISALKYVLIVGAILIVLLIIPVSREWLLNLLGFIK